MAFEFWSRSDDDWQWTWDSRTSPPRGSKAIKDDGFKLVFPSRLARAAEVGRLAGRTDGTPGTQWSILAAESWSVGDLLRLNDPDNDDFSLRELDTTAETVIAIAVEAVTSGARAAATELDSYVDNPFPAIVNVTANARFAVTDVNSTTPASSYVGEEASLDNSSGWQIDVTGSGAVEITDYDVDRGVFIVKFLAATIQDNPHD